MQTMAAKQRVSLRRQKVKKDDQSSENDGDAFEMKSPIGNVVREVSDDDAGPSNALLSPRFDFRSPNPTSSKSKHSPGLRGACLDDSLDKLSTSTGSGEYTPSKWDYLVPDFNSQPEGVNAEVLWDCGSPNAVRHLRRVGKDSSDIKELVKFFKEPPADKRSTSPPFQLQLLRASFQKQMQKKKKPLNSEKRKQRKLAKQRKQKQADKEREKQLIREIVSALEKRQELEAEETEAKESETTASAATVKTEDTEEDDDSDDVDKDSWEDDDLFENNSFIIAATQNPYQFLKEHNSKTSTPKHIDKTTSGITEVSDLKQLDHGFCVIDNSSDTDSQSSEVIPPTYVSPRLKKPLAVKPRNLFGASTGLSKQEAKEEEAIVDKQETRKPQFQTISSLGNFSDDMSDDEVPDELLLKVTEQCDTFHSQVIQEFPTQAPAKVSAPATLLSTRPVSIHIDDFADDLDPDILAKICEYDSSFSESPMRRRKSDNQLTESVPHGAKCEDAKPGHSDSKQPKLQESAKVTSSAIINIVNYGKVSGQRSCPAVSTKANSIFDNVVQNTKNAEPKVIFNNVQINPNQSPVSTLSAGQSSKPQNTKPANNSGMVFPPFFQNKQDKTKPLSSLAMGKTVSENHSRSGKKFVFKPVFSASASSTAHASLSKYGTAPVSNKWSSSNTAVNVTQASKFGTAAISKTSALNTAQVSRCGTMGVLKSSSTSALNTAQSTEVESAAVSNKLTSSTTAVNARQTSSHGPSCSQPQLDSTDNFMDDDPLYESEIMAILDQVESQATQQMATQASSSQETFSTQRKCSQEEIEKKRQAALQRKKEQAALQKRQQSKSRT